MYVLCRYTMYMYIGTCTVCHQLSFTVKLSLIFVSVQSTCIMYRKLCIIHRMACIDTWEINLSILILNVSEMLPSGLNKLKVQESWRRHLNDQIAQPSLKPVASLQQ